MFQHHFTDISQVSLLCFKCIENAYNYVSFLSHMSHTCLTFVSKNVVYARFKLFFEQKHALLHSQRRLIICKIRILSDRIHFLSRAPPLIPRLNIFYIMTSRFSSSHLKNPDMKYQHHLNKNRSCTCRPIQSGCFGLKVFLFALQSVFQ